jgi:hypothetical protein
MQLVLLYYLGVNGLERPQANVQSDFGGFNAVLPQALEDFRREVQAGGRGGYRAALTGVNRLITFPVGWLIGTVNVGRERHMAQALDLAEEIHGRLKTNSALAEASPGNYFGLKLTVLAKPEPLAHSYFSAWT